MVGVATAKLGEVKHADTMLLPVDLQHFSGQKISDLLKSAEEQNPALYEYKDLP